VAFNVQDDQGSVASANAYILTAFLDSYHADRGNSLGTASTSDKEKAVVKATDFLDRRYRERFIGIRLSSTQTTEWPRVNAFYKDGRIVQGIPVEVKQAAAELALRALTADLAPDPAYDETNRIVVAKSSKVGPIEESFTFADDGTILDWRQYPTVDGLLAELVDEGQRLLRA